MREFGLYWARIEGVWGYIAGLYVPQVCEKDSHEFGTSL